MLYLTDTWENRIQRISMGRFLRQCGLIVPGDCIVTIHASGNLYRHVSRLLHEFIGMSINSSIGPWI